MGSVSIFAIIQVTGAIGRALVGVWLMVNMDRRGRSSRPCFSLFIVAFAIGFATIAGSTYGVPVPAEVCEKPWGHISTINNCIDGETAITQTDARTGILARPLLAVFTKTPLFRPGVAFSFA
jgi:hypothetical protein